LAAEIPQDGARRRLVTDARRKLDRDTGDPRIAGKAAGGGRRAAAKRMTIDLSRSMPRSGFAVNDVDPQAWLADVLARINDIPQTRLHELLPWNWKAIREKTKVA